MLTFALNHAAGGEATSGYHAVNLLIHMLAGLLLLGLVRRTLLSDRLAGRYRGSATWLACTIALFWTIHPLQTESVTYIYQRGESLMGMCYLLLLYSLNRSAGRTAGAKGWSVLAVVACFLGMGSKPVMASAPLVALLYDCVFLTGSWRETIRIRKGFYLWLGASWGLLALILSQPNESSATAGFQLDSVSVLEYWRTQPGVLLHYLRLSLWPYGLVFDHGWPVAQGIDAILWPSLAVGLLMIATAYEMRKAPAAGFPGAWFFLTLAPSSLVPLADLAFEHRMYLALAGVMTVVVLGAHASLLALIRHGVRWRAPVAGVLAVVVGSALCLRTIQRNEVYRRRLTLWQDVISKRPDHARAYQSVATVFLERRRPKKAIKYLRKALKLNPESARARSNLGGLLISRGDLKAAFVQLMEAVRFDRENGEAYCNLGVVFSQMGCPHEAVFCFRKAIEFTPRMKAAYINCAGLLLSHGKPHHAAEILSQARKRWPKDKVLARQWDACTRVQTMEALPVYSPAATFRIPATLREAL